MSGVDPDFLRMLDGDGVVDQGSSLVQPVGSGLSDRRMGQLATIALAAAGLMIWSAVGGRDPSLAAMAGKPQMVSVDLFKPAGSVLPSLVAPVAGPIIDTVYVNGPAAAVHRVSHQVQPKVPTPDPAPAPTPVVPPGPNQKARSKINHVAVVVLPATDSRSAWPGPDSTEAPYMAGLRAQGTLLTNYRSVGASDLSNRIALISGQEPNAETERGCPQFKSFATPFTTDAGGNGLVTGDGCYYPYNEKSTQKWTIADGLSAQGGRSGPAWKAYVGDADKGPGGVAGVSGCRRPAVDGADAATTPTAADGFVTRLDPFVYFTSLQETLGCDSTAGAESNDVPLTALASDIDSDVKAAAGTGRSKLATYSMIIPTGCDAGIVADCGIAGEGAPRPTGAAAVDAFLKREVQPLIESPAFRRDGLVLITYDRAAFNTPADGAEPNSGLVGALLVGPYVKAGAETSTAYSHYSSLASIQDLLGLWRIGRARTGIAGKPTLNTFGSDIWAVGKNPFAKG